MIAGSPRAHVRNGPVAHGSDDFVTEPSHHRPSLVPWELDRLRRSGRRREQRRAHWTAVPPGPTPGRPARGHGGMSPDRPSRGRRSRGDGALGHVLGCWSPTADRVALAVLPDDGASGSRSSSATRSEHAVPRVASQGSHPDDRPPRRGGPAGYSVVGRHRSVTTAVRFRVVGRHLGGVRRCLDVGLSSGSNSPTSTW